MKILLTGGCGFIGSAVVRRAIRATDHEIVNVDKMTYAASEEALGGGAGRPAPRAGQGRHHRVAARCGDCFAAHQPDAVMHLAAESHVDRSIDGPATSCTPTSSAPSSCWRRRAAIGRRPGRRRAGRLPLPPCLHRRGVRRAGRRRPAVHRGPRRTTRAARTPRARRPPTIWRGPGSTPTGCRVIVSNTTNNYGPWQFPEKLIPLMILNALEEKPLPVYGDGKNTARLAVRGRPCRGAAAGGGDGRAGRDLLPSAPRQPRRNLDVVRGDLRHSGRLAPEPARPARAADHLS